MKQTLARYLRHLLAHRMDLWTGSIGGLVGLALAIVCNASPPSSSSPPSAPSSSPSAPASPTSAAATSHPPFSHYQPIIDRNLFMRSPVRSSSNRNERHGSNGSGGPASDWVLTGIVVTPNGAVAFIENQKNGQSILAYPGQRLEPGPIELIQADGLSIGTSSGSRFIAVGQALDGSSPAMPAIAAEPSASAAKTESVAAPMMDDHPIPPPPYSPALPLSEVPSSPAVLPTNSTSTATSASSSPPADSSKPSESEILARLRAKRQQEKSGR